MKRFVIIVKDTNNTIDGNIYYVRSLRKIDSMYIPCDSFTQYVKEDKRATLFDYTLTDSVDEAYSFEDEKDATDTANRLVMTINTNVHVDGEVHKVKKVVDNPAMGFSIVRVKR